MLKNVYRNWFIVQYMDFNQQDHGMNKPGRSALIYILNQGIGRRTLSNVKTAWVRKCVDLFDIREPHLD